MYQIYLAQMSVCVNSSDIELANKIYRIERYSDIIL